MLHKDSTLEKEYHPRILLHLARTLESMRLKDDKRFFYFWSLEIDQAHRAMPRHKVIQKGESVSCILFIAQSRNKKSTTHTA